MKKILLTIIYFTACILFVHAQVLFGTTEHGGNAGGGTINKFMPRTNTLAVIKSLVPNDSTDGSTPAGGLIQASDGRLYGVTVEGGAKGAGVIFSIDPFSPTYTKLWDFDKPNGANPQGSLLQAADGKLYGMTTSGGNIGKGVLYSFDPSSATYLKLVDFEGNNGAYPTGSLTQASNGKLYGMTPFGGNIPAPNDLGVIFSYDPSTATYTKLLDFDSNNGANPYGSFIQASDGKLYAMTSWGGTGGNTGVIFSFDPSTLTYQKQFDFGYPNGWAATGSLTQANDGKLYGMTSLGGITPDDEASGSGNIFSYDPAAYTYLELKDFDEVNHLSDGTYPHGNLMQASDGKLYGMLTKGGSINVGVAFSFDPSSSTYTKLIDFNGANGAFGKTYFGRNTCSGFIEIKGCASDTSYYRDTDRDGFGNPDISIKACSQPAGYVTDNTDCDDTKPSVHPGATEICGNGIDDNCNGQVDEDCSIEPTVSINDVTVNESQGVARLTVTLSHASSKPVWLLYYTKDGTAVSRGRHKDFKAEFGLVFIRPGSLTGTISIRIFKDNLTEPVEYFDVILWRSLHADIADGSGRVSISDDMQVTNSKIEFIQGAEIMSANRLEIKVMPNPSSSQFNLTVESNNKTAGIDIKVMDVQGKLMEGRNNITPDQTLKIGASYRPGTYFIQAVQGKQRVTTTVVKLSQ